MPNAGALLPLREGILNHVAERAEVRRFPLTPQQVVHDVRQVMPKDGIVCLDNGMYKIWFARNYRTHVANTLLLDNALRDPDRPPQAERRPHQPRILLPWPVRSRPRQNRIKEP